MYLLPVALLESRYTLENDIEYTEEDYLAEFFTENEITSFQELFFNVFECEVKNVRTLKKAKLNQIKMISYMYKKYHEISVR